MNAVSNQFSTLTKITEIGHGFFACDSVKSAAMYITVQSRKVINFDRSIITKGASIIAVSGQDEISKTSPINKDIKKLYREVRKNTEASILGGSSANSSIIHVPIICPTTKIRWDWFIEAPDAEKYIAASTLLAKHYSEGLLHLYRKRNILGSVKKFLSIPFILLIAFILACFYVELPEKVIAPVKVEFTHSESARSSIDGLVIHCLPEGTYVKKGQIIGGIDVNEFQHELKDVLKSQAELTLKIDKTTKDSLNDTSKLVEIQLLKNEEEKLRLKISYLKFKLDSDKILSPINGVIRYKDEISRSKDSNVGRYLKKGEILCFIDDVYSSKAMINLSETDVHILNTQPKIGVYYHRDPDNFIDVQLSKIPDVPSVDSLTQNYVYALEADTKHSPGETGVAHLKGEKVLLGYFLFKKLFHYFRGF